MEIIPTKQYLHGWGSNQGQRKLLKTGKKARLTVPQKMKMGFTVQSIASNDNCILVLSKQGEVYQYTECNPNKVSGLSDIVKIGCGKSHQIVMNSQGKCFAWGTGTTGCLGNYSFKDLTQPTPVMTDFVIRDFECGAYTSFFVTSQGQMYGCGSNSHGQLGTNTQKHFCLPHKIDTKGIVVKQIAAGETHTLFLSKQGNIYACGNGRQGQLGLRQNYEDFCSPKLQKIHIKQKFIKVCASNYSAAISDKGTIFVWGTSVFGTHSSPTVFSKINKKFIDLAISSDSGYALTEDGQIWTWGGNQYGELGVGDNCERVKPFPLIMLENRIVDKIFAGNGVAFCLSSNEKQQKVFKRQCCVGPEHNHKPQVPLNRVSLGKDKENRSFNHSLNRSVVSKVTKSQRSNKLSFVHEHNKSKDSKDSKISREFQGMCITNKRTKSKAKRKAPKVIQDDFASAEASDRQSLPSNINNSEPNIHVLAEIRKQFIDQKRQNRQNIYHIDRNRSSTPQPKIFEKEKVKIDELTHYKKENQRLLKIIEEKNFIINDITQKIRLLQDAIAEKEKLDDSGVKYQNYAEQFRKNQKRYLSQIEKLTQMLNSLINQKRLSHQSDICESDGSTIPHKHFASYDPGRINMVDVETQNYSVLRSLNRDQQLDNSQAITLKEEVICLEKQIYKQTQQYQTTVTQNRACIEQLTAKLQEMERLLTEKDRLILNLKRELEFNRKAFDEIDRTGKLQEQNLIEIIKNREDYRNNTSFDESAEQIASTNKRRQQRQVDSSEVQKTLLKIEQNRRRISHSANKLIHILDMSM